MLNKILKPTISSLPRISLPSAPHFHYSVTTTARVAPQNELFYKRDLPPNLIPFSSLEGKNLFQEAYKQGNMEAYFTLAEHLINQAEPSTCGPTSLSMIVNTLHIDPNRHWKGVWKWSSEYNLYCCPEDYLKNGLNFEQFANLAHCNRTKLQAFYHKNNESEIPLITKGENSGKVVHSKIDFNHEGLCVNQHGLLLKYSSYTTFLNNLITSSRRTGLYMVMNFSRKHLGQTGDGHFNPVAGVHISGKSAKALILDLAKFKYPAYWVDCEILYESMREMDSSTGRSRGYVVISANKEINPSSRGVSEDTKSVEAFNKHLKGIPRKMSRLAAESESKTGKKIGEEDILYKTLIHLGRDCNYLFTQYLYDLSIRLESKIGQEQRLFTEIESLEKTKLCAMMKSALVNNCKNMNNHQIFWLTYDYQPYLMANVLTMVLYALEKKIVTIEGQDLGVLFNESGSLSETLKQEIGKIQKLLGVAE